MLAGCVMTGENLPLVQSPVGLDTMYDSRLVDAAATKAISLPELVKSLEDADVVFFGEYHGHQGAHLLQSQLQVALHQQQPRQILSMEQFSVNHQATLNRYLSGELGEAELIDDAEAWPNYRASYRALVEYAKTQSSPVVAANVPAEVARCVGRAGAGYLDTLDTVAALLARAPDLEVRVISPVLKNDTTTPLSESELALGDIVYVLRPLPTEYRDTDRQFESLSKQFKNARAKSCGLGN